jgi:phosphinothricin acetyltransferase
MTTVRDATIDDSPSIADLYNALIPSTTVAWTGTLQTVAERTVWLRRQSADGFPVLVAEIDRRVVGFASYGPFRGAGKWPGYDHTAEHTIHVARDAWGRGIGRSLVDALVERAQAAAVHVLVAAIDANNDASLRFHTRLGFAEVARMPEVGHKFGRWLDLVLMQRVLDDRTTP